MINKPDWWPKCPYPTDLFPMNIKHYSAIVPDPEIRTGLSGCLGRHFWNMAEEAICASIEEAIRDNKIRIQWLK